MKLKMLFVGLINAIVFYPIFISTMNFDARHDYASRKSFAELWHEHNPTLISHEIVFDRSSHNHEVTGTKISFYDKNNNLYYERHFQGREFEKFAQECKSMFKGMSLEDAIIQRVNYDIEKAHKDDAIHLITLLQPRFSESGTPLNSHSYENIKPDQNHDIASGPTKQQIEQVLLRLHDQKPFDFSQREKAFYRWAAKHNTAIVAEVVTLSNAITNARSHQKSCEKLTKGIQELYDTIATFFRDPRSIKNICDLYKATIYSGEMETRSELIIEAHFDDIKKSIINHFIAIRHDKVILHNPSVNVQQIQAQKVASFFKQCAPQIYSRFLSLGSVNQII